jgi:hypothetical protein
MSKCVRTGTTYKRHRYVDGKCEACGRPKPVKVVKVTIGAYHDYIAMNHKEVVFDPTPEDCDRILRESVIMFEEGTPDNE